MQITKILSNIDALFTAISDGVDDIDFKACGEDEIRIVETTKCWQNPDNIGSGQDLYLDISINPSNNWEYHIQSYILNLQGKLERMSIQRHGEEFENLLNALNKPFELEDGQKYEWHSPKLLYNTLTRKINFKE